MNSADQSIETYGASNYAPAPVVLVKGEGVYVWDDHGRRYMDMLGAYSAASFGHCHPRLVAALSAQAARLDTVSRAFLNDRLGPFLKRACLLTGFDRGLPMNSGAEAVETALKAARKWAYKVKGVAEDQAEIICCTDNFHGRTIAITGMSSVSQYRDGFGPFAPGFKKIAFGRSNELAAAITMNTAAFLVEPIQGEGGIVVPPPGYLAQCAKICKERNVLLLCDEVQTGLGRTGKVLACEHDSVKPDGVTLGKALGGGLVPVSLFLARRDVIDVFAPGDHGSTFGGNPVSAAVALEALTILVDENLVARAEESGAYMMAKLKELESSLITEIRGKGLLIGIELRRDRIAASELCERLAANGILTNDTHRNVVRFAPPLAITRPQIDSAVERLSKTLNALERPLAAID